MASKAQPELMATIRPISSARQWIVVGLVALAALIVAYDAFDRGRARFLRAAFPVAALEQSPTDMVALQKVIDRSIATGKPRRISEAEYRNARAALIAAPINGPAFRIVGMHADQSGNSVRAGEAFTLSNEMSRRNSFVQLWLIEDAVRKDNVPQALAHYNAALSVRPALFNLLFPILSSAMSDPVIRAALRPYVLRQSSWAGSLLAHAATRGDPHHVLVLLEPLASKLDGSSFDDVSRTLADRLVEYGDVAAAARVVSWRRPMFKAGTTSLRVSEDSLDSQLGVFAWRLLNEQGLNVTPNDQQGFDVTARPLANGDAALRVVPVLAGRQYVFQHKLQGEASIQGSYKWQAICAGDKEKKPIFDQLVSPSDRVQRWSFFVPERCTGLYLGLSASGPDGALPTTVSVTDLRLQEL